MIDQLLVLAQSPAAWAAFLTLVALEIVLGIDNLIFISILTNKLPEKQRPMARRIGLSLALVMRLALLSVISIIVGLTQPVVSALGQDFSWRDIILISGGLFLVWKATREIHHAVDPEPGHDAFGQTVATSFAGAVVQIILVDLVFSIDSIITAVGMTNDIPIMILAVIIAVAAMALMAGPLAAFIATNPSIVMLALAFLLMIGMTLIAEGFEVHVPKGYIYAAMAFSVLVELLNMVARRARGTARKVPADHPSPVE